MERSIESDWKEQHENILKEWKMKCFVNMWLQDASAYYYLNIHNWLTYPVIIITSMSSAALFATDNEVMKYIVGVLTLSSGILTAITRHMKPGELHQHHLLTSRRYQNLIKNIDACLTLTKCLRPAASSFIDKVSNEMDNLSSSQVEPPYRIINKFEYIYGSLDKKLYGEDIVELLKLELKTNQMFKQIQRSDRLSIDVARNKMNREQSSKQSQNINASDSDSPSSNKHHIAIVQEDTSSNGTSQETPSNQNISSM